MTFRNISKRLPWGLCKPGGHTLHIRLAVVCLGFELGTGGR